MYTSPPLSIYRAQGFVMEPEPVSVGAPSIYTVYASVIISEVVAPLCVGYANPV
jgi:hypothetical protein